VLSARGLGPTDRGVLAAVMAGPLLVMGFSVLGLDDALTRFVASGQIAPRGARRLVWSRVLCWGVLVGALLWPVQALAVLRGRYLLDATLVVLATPVYTVHRACWGVLAGCGSMARWNLAKTVGNMVYATAIVALYATHQVSVRAAVVSWCLAWCVALSVSSTGRAWHATGPPQPARRLWPLLRYGLTAGAGTVSSELNQRVDQVALALLVPAADLGLYAVAATVSLSPGAVPASYAAYAFAACSRTADTGVRQRLGRRFVLRGWVISALVYAIVALFAPVLVRYTFGAAFTAAVPTTRWLCLGAALLFGAGTSAAVLKAENRPGDVARAQLSALAVTLGGLVVLVPRMGVPGAAVTSVLAYATAAVLMSVSVRRVLAAPPVTPAAVPHQALAPREAARGAE
jgi:O-antigen/teichoic acid export membrane protein